MFSVTNQITLDELYQHAKKCCEQLKICRSRLSGNKTRELSKKELSYIPSIKCDQAFKLNNPHEITNVIIEIAMQLSDMGGYNDALDILDKARETPLQHAQYRNHFFSHQTCLEKINAAYEKIFNKKIKEKNPENIITETLTGLARMCGR